MRLVKFEINADNPELWNFTLQHKGQTKTMILKEKSFWPMIFGSPVEYVEKWLLTRYDSLCYLAFGIL